MAEENATWGHRHIQGALKNLGHHIDAITVRNILRRHDMEPTPQRRKTGMSWSQFLKRHWEVLAATDFLTVEVATWHGLVTYYVLAVMELATRRVHKEEALTQMVILGERTLYYAIQQYLAHYHHERNHQGLANQLIAREEAVGCQTGRVVRRDRLGGLLSYYHREAA